MRQIHKMIQTTTASQSIRQANKCCHQQVLRRYRNQGAPLLWAIILIASYLSSTALICCTSSAAKSDQLTTTTNQFHHYQKQQKSATTNLSSIELQHQRQHHRRLQHETPASDLLQATQPLVASQTNEQTSASLSSSMLRAYIRTNNMRAYHLDLHNYRPADKFIGDPAHIDSRQPAHVATCRSHLNQYHSLMRAYMETDPMQGVSLDSLKLADTYGRPGAGLVSGHQFWLGSYEACVEYNTQDNIKSHYCLAVSQFPSWNPRDSMTSIKVGVCLPESCTSSMLNEHSDLFNSVEQMMKYQIQTPLNKIRLRSIYCLPHESSQVRKLTTSGSLLLIVFGVLIFACACATIIDHLNRKTNKVASNNVLAGAKRLDETRNWRIILVESFSLLRNFDKFWSNQVKNVDNSKEQDNVQTINGDSNGVDSGTSTFNKGVFFDSITGIKCIGLIWIIAAHTLLVGPITHRNLTHLDSLTKTYLANVLLAAHLMVDTFFALSGLLCAYLIFKGDISRIKLKHWIVLTIHRYWRLTPIYLLCYWFTKSLGHLLNDGPLWDYSTAINSPRTNCANESWLTALLHLSDFKSPKDHCVPFAWFIANGIKFWLVTPFFLLAIHKSIKRGYTLTSAVILANCALVVALAYNSNVDMKSVIEFKPESADNMLNNMEVVYTRPYSRISTYLVGLLAGHIIYLVETKQQQVNISEQMKILIWTLVSAILILLTFMMKIAGGVPLEESAIPFIFSFCSGIIRPLWALCTCWLVFALAHGQAKWLASFLTARFWRPLAKLSFCAYLAQGEVIANLYLAGEHSSPYTYLHMVTNPIVATVLTIAVSFVLVLLVEYPLHGIEELVLPAKTMSSNRKRNTHQINEAQKVNHNDDLVESKQHHEESTNCSSNSALVSHERKLKEL